MVARIGLIQSIPSYFHLFRVSLGTNDSVAMADNLICRCETIYFEQNQYLHQIQSDYLKS